MENLGIIARTKARLLSSKLDALQSDQQQQQQQQQHHHQRSNAVVDIPPIILAPPGGYSIPRGIEPQRDHESHREDELVNSSQLTHTLSGSPEPKSKSNASDDGQFSPFTERKRLHAATELRLRERLAAAEARSSSGANALPPVTPSTSTNKDEVDSYRPAEQFRAATIGKQSTVATTTKVITNTPLPVSGYQRGFDNRFSPSPEPVPRIFIPPAPIQSNSGTSSRSKDRNDLELQSTWLSPPPPGKASTTRVKWMDSLRTNEMPSPTRKGETFLLSPPAFDTSIDVRSSRKSASTRKDEALATYSAVERAVQEEAEATRLESILESLRLRGTRLESELDEALEDAKKAEKDAAEARTQLENVAAMIEKEGMDSVSRVTRLRSEVDAAKLRFEREQRTGSAVGAVKQGAIDARLAPLQQKLDGEWQSVAAFEEDVLPELKAEAERSNLLKDEVESMKISLQLAKKGALSTEIRQSSARARAAKEQDVTLLLEVTEGLPELEQHVVALRSIVSELKEMLNSVRQGLEVDCYTKIDSSLKELERIKTERLELERLGFGSAKEVRSPRRQQHTQLQKQQKQSLGPQQTLIRRASLISFINEADKALERADKTL